MSKTADTIKKAKPIVLILYAVLGVILLVSFCFTNSFVKATDNPEKQFFGLYAHIVRSNDMAKTNFKLGDVVLSQKVNVDKLRLGDIITFRSTNPQSAGQLVSHKIKSIGMDDAGRTVFETYSTATGAVDDMKVRADEVIGRCHWSIANAGYFVILMQYVPVYVHLFVLISYLIGAMYLTYRYASKRMAWEAYSMESAKEMEVVGA